LIFSPEITSKSPLFGNPDKPYFFANFCSESA